MSQVVIHESAKFNTVAGRSHDTSATCLFTMFNTESPSCGHGRNEAADEMWILLLAATCATRSCYQTDMYCSKLIHAYGSARYRPIFTRVPEHLHQFSRLATGIPKHFRNYWQAYFGGKSIQSRKSSDTRFNDAWSLPWFPLVVRECLQHSCPLQR